ncbi:MAG TPA: hypothetical protein VI197_18785 [Polyangiaceae bacterium]
MSSDGPASGRISEPDAARHAWVRRTARSLGTLLVAVSFIAARPASADEPEREVRHDPTAFPAPSTRLPLFAIGAATSLVWYGGAVGGAYLYPTANGADELKIPIAGPWMSLAETGCPSTTPDCSTFWMVVGGILKGFSGIGQAGGVLLMVEGLFLPTVEPRTKAASTRWQLTLDDHATSASSSVVVLPAPLPGGAGLSVLGLF